MSRITITFINGTEHYRLRSSNENYRIEDLINKVASDAGLNVSVGSLRVNQEDAVNGQRLYDGDTVELVKKAGIDG